MEKTVKKVKGIFFKDYVRMIRGRKGVDWSKYLAQGDMAFLDQKISPEEWFPFDTFERMGLAIFHEIAGGNLEAVRSWGRGSIDALFSIHGSLISEGNPKESFIRYQVVRNNLFNFDAVQVLVIFDNFAKLEIAYGMSDTAEQAAVMQTLGYFERLLALSGATNIRPEFTRKMWEGDPSTILELNWSMHQRERAIRGSFLVDYARLIRGRKDIAWESHLKKTELDLVRGQVDSEKWYPLESFELMALAIYKEIAFEDFDRVRLWGRASIDRLYQDQKDMISDGNPRESLMRFQALRKKFFNFDPILVERIEEDRSLIRFNFGMAWDSEEVATFCFLGYFERILELSGARDLEYRFLGKTWEGDSDSVVEFSWSEMVSRKKVRGELFLDYVKMLKSKKGAPWEKYLSDHDLSFLKEVIVLTDWYPFDAFERMGLGIFSEIAKCNVELARSWGHFSMQELFRQHEALVAPEDPRESIMRYQVFRRGFFNFEPIVLRSLLDESAVFHIDYGMSPKAEEAATYQTLGFFEKLISLAGADEITHEFSEKAWEGDERTVLGLRWQNKPANDRQGGQKWERQS